MTMIILRDIIYKNVDCGNCVRDYVSAEVESEVVCEAEFHNSTKILVRVGGMNQSKTFDSIMGGLFYKNQVNICI